MARKTEWSQEELDILKNMFFEDKSDKEIAEALNLTIDQVKNKIKKLNFTQQHKRPTRLKNLIGQKFTRLLVTRRGPNLVENSRSQKARWYCDCDCGKKDVLITGYALTSGSTRSCGCLQRELTSIRSKASRTENQYIIDKENNIAIGLTGMGVKFVVDLEDLEKIRQYKWQNTQDGYIQAHDFDKKRTTIRLNRLIMNVHKKDWLNTQVDHINHDPRDNRKCNLRVATASENGRNKNSKGFNFHKATGRWNARITKDGERINLGLYDTEEEALNAVNKFRQELNDDFSYQKSMELAEKNGCIDFDKYNFNKKQEEEKNEITRN